eukprot:GFUD01042703.1.p1 GENE.GFUD01042703.1~~GFUD01042703.1.p1  ORF type:complete len:181 (+),score=56.07 GFUD01042703.1:187-729(+)
MTTDRNYLGLARRYFRGKSWEVKIRSSYLPSSYRYLPDREEEEGQTCLSACCNILHLPDDVWLGILSSLQILDIVRCEMSCTMLQDLIVYYGVYKARLDMICRRKRINNYMVLPETVRTGKTEQEISAYYKSRLYHYTNKCWPRQVEEDEYVQTYKVGKKKQELDNLVLKGMKKFSIIGV